MCPKWLKWQLLLNSTFLEQRMQWCPQLQHKYLKILLHIGNMWLTLPYRDSRFVGWIFCPLYKRVVPAYWNVFYSLWDRPWLNTFRTKTFVQFWRAMSGGALFKNCLFLICLLLRRWLWKWESDFFMQERRKGKFQRDTFWNEHHLDAQKEHQILFSFSLSLSLFICFFPTCLFSSPHFTSWNFR